MRKAVQPPPENVAARPRGEPLVWLSAAGLSAGILMAAVLLGLIAWEGARVFWPRSVVEISLQKESGGAAETVAGSLVKVQENRGGGGLEWQIFTGNKDAYGSMFRYIDRNLVENTGYPEDIVVAERTEYGKAIFYPLSITTTDNRQIKAGETGFWKAFRNEITSARDRFEEINILERREIGAINRKVSQLNRKRRDLERREAAGRKIGPEAYAPIDRRLADLEAEFAVLAEKAGRLRELQQAGRIRYRLPDGQVRSQPLGDIMDVYRPNDMNLLQKGIRYFQRIWTFLSERPREANTEGGIFPAIFGTFVMTLLMSVAVMPFGVIAALYLREYAKQGPFVRMVRISVNNLAGVPSIVYGVFGLGFFVYFVGGSIDQLLFGENLPTATFGTGGILWASLTLALMTVPVVVVATEEALAAVPSGSREASLACGASKWQTIQRIVLPASAPGILTGLILAMARGAGEVAPLMLVGVVKLAPSLPIDGEFPFLHLERKFMHLGFHIYDLGFQSPDSEAARPMVFATTLLLIILVLSLNLGAVLIRNRLRSRYQTLVF